MDLDSRKQRILQAIVLDYVRTAEPVGSNALLTRYDLGCKSATIRNEMAEMEERGYLRQPHTSAGRIPSGQGYRFYVNRLMVVAPLETAEARTIRQEINDTASEMEAILRRTCQLLTQITQLPAVATPPEAEAATTLRQVFVSPTAADTALLVVLFSTGRTEHRLVPNLRLDATASLVIASALNERLVGRALAELRTLDLESEPVPASLSASRGSYLRLLRELSQTARTIAAEDSVYMEGTQAALAQPEFRDVERLGQFFGMIQERAALLEMLGRELTAAPVTVRIGEELGKPELSEFAIVASPYYVGTSERGSLGVVGPTRMDYARVAAAVQFMASSVSLVLTKLASA